MTNFHSVVGKRMKPEGMQTSHSIIPTDNISFSTKQLIDFRRGSVPCIHIQEMVIYVTVTGATVTSTLQLPQEPPPLVLYDNVIPLGQNLFVLAFVLGSISVCRGCRPHYQKPGTAPMDLRI